MQTYGKLSESEFNSNWEFICNSISAYANKIAEGRAEQPSNDGGGMTTDILHRYIEAGIKIELHPNLLLNTYKLIALIYKDQYFVKREERLKGYIGYWQNEKNRNNDLDLKASAARYAKALSDIILSVSGYPCDVVNCNVITNEAEQAQQNILKEEKIIKEEIIHPLLFDHRTNMEVKPFYLTKEMRSNLPKREWWVNKLAVYEPKVSLVIISGLYKVGKTLFIIELVQSLLKKNTFLNLEINRDKVKNILLIPAETSYNVLCERLNQWESGNPEYADLQDKVKLIIWPAPINLMENSNPDYSYNQIRQIQEFIIRYDINIVITDPLIKFTPGLNENAADTVMPVLNNIKNALWVNKPLLWVCTHHTDKSGNSIRGSGALPGEAESFILIKKLKDSEKENKRNLKLEFVCRESNLDPIRFSWKFDSDIDPDCSPFHMELVEIDKEKSVINKGLWKTLLSHAIKYVKEAVSKDKTYTNKDYLLEDAGIGDIKNTGRKLIQLLIDENCMLSVDNTLKWNNSVLDSDAFDLISTKYKEFATAYTGGQNLKKKVLGK